MADLKTFASNMRKRSQAVNKNTDSLVRRVAESVLATVVNDTPIDTGQAKSNWQVRLNLSAADTIPAYVPGKDGSTSRANLQATIEAGVGVIREYNSGQEIHITNNLPYIGELNDGWSNQAPPNYVQDAVLEAIGTIQEASFTIVTNIGEVVQ